MISRAILLCVVQLLAVSASLEEYACSFCTGAVDRATENSISSFMTACNVQFPSDICMMFRGKDFTVDFHSLATGSVSSRQICELNNICEPLGNEVWRSTSASSTGLDIRVSKAYGSRGYNNIRLSIISNATIESEYFTYSEPFKYRWTQYYLNTGIVSVVPGEKTKFTIAGEDIEVLVPVQGEGTRGVIIADPCFTSEYIICVYAKKFEMFDHLTTLLNAVNAHDDVSYWNILGDNFYDQVGDNTGKWFNALSKESRSKVFGTVPGNHVRSLSFTFLFLTNLHISRTSGLMHHQNCGPKRISLETASCSSTDKM